VVAAHGHYRTREYLTEREVGRLMKSAGRNRYGHRDATMILLAFRHGLRASELCSLRCGSPQYPFRPPFSSGHWLCRTNLLCSRIVPSPKPSDASPWVLAGTDRARALAFSAGGDGGRKSPEHLCLSSMGTRNPGLSPGTKN